jgi:Uma2 family endonuclease
VTSTPERKLDYSDYVAIPEDGKRYEVLEGSLLVTPAPSPQHQWTSKRLQRQLEAYFEARSLGMVFAAPIDVILSTHDILQPDLVVVERRDQISKRGIESAPLLVVEILSPSTRHQDRIVKSGRCAALGILHLWLVDPDLQNVQCYRATAGKYEIVTQARGRETLEHPDWRDLRVDLATLWF